MNNKSNHHDNNNANSNKFEVTSLIAIFGMILITLILILNTDTVAVFAQSINVNSSESNNQTQGLQDLCKLPPQELARNLHGMHLNGC